MNQAILDVQPPSQDERTMATLAHVLQLVGWWIAPLVIFLVKRESRFTSFHALQALLLQIFQVILMVAFMVLMFVSMFSMVPQQPTAKDAHPPVGFFLLFPLIWLVFLGYWAGLITIAVVYGIKAGRGEWAEYPLLGRLARKLLKISPGGAFLSATQ